jgi:hypothetical protein
MTMRLRAGMRAIAGSLFMCVVAAQPLRSETVALWLFDEQAGIYPSCVLGDASENDFPLVLGRGGRIVPGRFGNALQAGEAQESETLDGAVRSGGSVGGAGHSMTWSNAKFCGLATRGEKDLRQEVDFGSPTRSRLNLGDFDWTVEFWYQAVSAPLNGGDGLRTGDRSTGCEPGGHKTVVASGR